MPTCPIFFICVGGGVVDLVDFKMLLLYRYDPLNIFILRISKIHVIICSIVCLLKVLIYQINSPPFSYFTSGRKTSTEEELFSSVEMHEEEAVVRRGEPDNKCPPPP